MTPEDIIKAWSAECLHGPVRYVLDELGRAGLSSADAKKHLADHFDRMSATLSEAAGNHESQGN